MEPNTPAAPAPGPSCPVCHQAVLPAYYFCPNCGTELNPRPLPTGAGAQAKLYLHSIILPMIVFITSSKWLGFKYFKSEDKKAKQIGAIAIALVVLSTALICWYAYVWTQDTIQASIAGINADFGM
jgi:hypothetical protein